MSNFLGIATVTASLTQVLQDAIDLDFSGASVKPARPDGFKTDTTPRGVSVFLYQVTPDAAWRNADLPTRRSDGSVVQRPQVALVLHYILSFFGDDQKLEPQRILGSVVSALHGRPLLTRDTIRNVIAAAVKLDPSHFLGKSDLADQVEQVRFTSIPLSLEELSRLWSVFFQTPYALSVLYDAAVVLIESKETAQTALPVQERGVFAVPFQMPTIREITPQILDFAVGAKIRLNGNNLAGAGVKVRIGAQELAPDSPQSNDSLTVTLPAGLLAGANTVQVVQSFLLAPPGKAPTPHSGFESNSAVFILQPHLTSITFAPAAGPAPATVTAHVIPDVSPAQPAVLLLNELNPPAGKAPRAFNLASSGRLAPTGALSFPVTGVPAATYLVRLKIDDAASALTFDLATGLYNGPTVTIA